MLGPKWTVLASKLWPLHDQSKFCSARTIGDTCSPLQGQDLLVKEFRMFAGWESTPRAVLERRMSRIPIEDPSSLKTSRCVHLQALACRLSQASLQVVQASSPSRSLSLT